MNIYIQSYYREYVVKKYSCQHLFNIFLWYLIIALPFYFSFGGQNFWLNSNQQIHRCQYNFTGYYAIQINSISIPLGTTLEEDYSNVVGYSANQLQMNKIQINDQTDKTTIQLKLSGFQTKQIINFNIIFYYKINIEDLNKQVYVALLQNYSGNYAYLQTTGFMTYQPQKAINNMNNFQKFNSPSYYPNLKTPNSFESLVDYIIQSDEVHRLSHQRIQVSSKSFSSSERTFKFNLIKDTDINIAYYPGILQTLKFSFSRWFAFTLIAYFIFYNLIGLLVKEGSVPAKIHDQQIK